MSNKKIFFLALVLFIVTLIFHSYAKKQPEGKESEGMFDFLNRPIQWKGRYAPDFDIDLSSGEKFKLSDNIGKKIIILNFFATWCGPCKEELPELIAFFEKHKEEQVILIGINDGENSDKVKTFMKEFRVNFPVAIDSHDRIKKIFDVRSFPTTIFIGADGVVQNYEIGQIMNADIAFDAIYKISMDTLKARKGIDRSVYFKKLNEQEALKGVKKEKDEDEAEKLDGRARTIAEEMNCPCGCSDHISDCNCKTAKDIKKRLKEGLPARKTAEEIIKELNKEFCVKSKKDGHDKG